MIMRNYLLFNRTFRKVRRRFVSANAEEIIYQYDFTNASNISGPHTKLQNKSNGCSIRNNLNHTP